tara:strand:+ start:902 stop:2236 length:1335 start_codon:yes stop_codon:yes gene_type:complete
VCILIKYTQEKIFKTFLKFPKKNILLILFVFGFGEWLISDIVQFSGGSLVFMILCFGAYFYLRNDKAIFNEPKNMKGWIDLCEEDLNYFEELEKENNLHNKNSLRRNSFEEILEETKEQRICLVSETYISQHKLFFDKYLKENNYVLNTIEGLPANISGKVLPDNLSNKEAVFYHLKLPLKAKDLLWINKFSNNLKVWLTISNLEGSLNKTEFDEFQSQIPKRYKNRVIKFDPNNRNHEIPISFRKFIFNPKKNIEDTKIRLLREFHTELQEEIDVIRRIKLKEIQNRNQFVIAATVFASPIPSIDVLSLAILNSLMIKEIKNTWDCNWSPEMLNKISKQIIKTALAQGVIEWSSQTLLTMSKFHGPNWLIAGSVQAISAAYLTRVVSRSLADFMSITKGVSEPSLDFINNNSEIIVENAFESEKINWKSLISEIQNSLSLKYS